MADSTALLPPSLRGQLIGKEKITGTVVSLGILGGVGYGVYLALPVLASIMTNVFAIGASALGITVLAYAVLNKGMRSVFKLGFAVLTRKLHNLIVQNSPYDIVNYVIGCWKERIADGQQKLGVIRGANKRLSDKISQNEATIADKRARARAAEQQGRIALKESNIRIMGNLIKINERNKAQLELQEKLTERLQKGLESAQIKVDEQEETVKMEIENNSLLTDVKAATSDVVAAISGDPEKKALFDEAMSVIAQDSAEKYGQIDQMWIDLQPLLNDIELGKMVDLERGQQMLESFDSKVEQIAAAPRVRQPAKAIEAEPVRT